MNYLDNNTRKLHLWYPLTALKEEISMRTAYLGKLRRTENAHHLLDLIHMTDDEEQLLMSCATNAMADLYEPLSKYARSFSMPTMVMNDGVNNSIGVPNNMGVECDVFTDNTLLALPTKNPIDIDVTVRTKSNNSFDRQRYSVALFVEVTYTTGYQIKGLTSFTYIPDETSTQVIRINTTGVSGNDFQGKYKFAVPLKGETDTLTESYIISCQIKFHSVTLYAINAKDVPQFGWVEYDNKVYLSSTDHADENDFLDTVIFQLKPNNGRYVLFPSDPRYSIRYLISYPPELNTQFVLPLDIAIHEALVCHIIKNWLEYAYPDEAANWHAKYDKALIDVRKRCNVQEKPIKKLIPRWF